MCEVPTLEKNDTKSGQNFTKSEENIPIRDHLSPPDPNFSPSCDFSPSESTLESVEEGLVKSVVRFPRPKDHAKDR